MNTRLPILRPKRRVPEDGVVVADVFLIVCVKFQFAAIKLAANDS